MKTIKSIFLALTIALFSSCESDQLEDSSTSNLLETETTALTEKGGCNTEVLRNNISYRLVVRNLNGREETYNIPRSSIDRDTRGFDIEIRLRDAFSSRFLSSGVDRIILRSRGDFQFPTSFNSQPGARVNGRLMLFGLVDTNIGANRRLNAVTRVPGRFTERDLSVLYQIDCGNR